jgi:diamine N-acetyltransferase
VTLRAIDRENVRAICDTRVAAHQRHLVGPAAYTIAEGTHEPDAVLRGIFAGDTPVGVLLVEVDTGTPYLVRFMIDAAQQGRGFGSSAVERLAEELRVAGWGELEVTFVPTANDMAVPVFKPRPT